MTKKISKLEIKTRNLENTIDAMKILLVIKYGKYIAKFWNKH